MQAIEVEATRRRLSGGTGGYEIVHRSPGLEVGVYVVVPAGADHRFTGYEGLSLLVMFTRPD